MDHKNDTNRCTGHCCEMFLIDGGQTLDDIKKTVEKALKQESERKWELLKIYTMIIPLGVKEVDFNGVRFPKPVSMFTCKHFNTVTRDCMDYENRPKMCREYPYGKKCGYKGCTLEP